jgi:hypothetical protein
MGIKVGTNRGTEEKQIISIELSGLSRRGKDRATRPPGNIKFRPTNLAILTTYEGVHYDAVSSTTATKVLAWSNAVEDFLLWSFLYDMGGQLPRVSAVEGWHTFCRLPHSISKPRPTRNAGALCSHAAGRSARVFVPPIGCSGSLCRGGGRPGATHWKVIQPEMVLRRRRHGIAVIWKYRSRGRRRGGRPGIALETRQLISEMARANFLWGAPRIHGELLKLGITVPQATVSRYMPPSRNDRRSQAWRTFIRNHTITIVHSCSFNWHNWGRDLFSQVRSRSRAFTYHLSAFVVAPVTGPSCWTVGIRSIHSLLP